MIARKSSIPNSIANLSNLTTLSLEDCESLVELPANIGQLVSLTRLYLSRCKKIKYLPNTIANLSSLTSLSLEFCESLVELPANIGQLVSLTHLELFDCKKIEYLPNTITNLSNLRSLSLHYCESLVELPENIGHLVSLTHLNLPFCYEIKYLPNSIANLSNLTSLFLHNCHSLVELPANIGHLVSLTHLCLADFENSRIKCLPWSIMKLRKLRHLMLPYDFRLQTLPDKLNNLVMISVPDRHVRKSWEELKKEMGKLPNPVIEEIPNDSSQNHSVISPPGYLRLEGDPSQWIINNTNLLMLVRFLDLGFVKNLTDSITQFSELTHLYLYNTVDICLPDNYFVTLTRLTHLSLEFDGNDIDDMSLFHSLSKLSNLESLHLSLLQTDLPATFNMPVSLKHLSLSYCDMRLLYDSLEKLTDLKTLDLHDCHNCVSLPPNISPAKLRLVDCSFQSLPTGLRYLEILSYKINKSNKIFEKCWNQLANLETLSITSSYMELLPEEIAKLRSLQILQLKDCVNLKKLPSNLHELVNLHTLDISITSIKSLPPSFVKLRNLQRLILPKCFNLESLPTNLKRGSIIDDMDKEYYEYMDYDASLYQTSTDTSDESKNKETEQSVVPGESCNETINTVPVTGVDETVSAEQESVTSSRAVSHYFNLGEYYAPTTSSEQVGKAISNELEEGTINEQLSPHTPIIGDFRSNRRENLNPSQIISFIQNDQNDITTMETEQGNGENNRHASENGKGENQILQNDMKSKKRQKISRETIQLFWSNNKTLEDSAKQIGVSRSTLKRRLKDLNLTWLSSKNESRHLDANKRKYNSKAPFESDSSLQNLVNLGNSTTHSKTVGQCIMGANQHTLSNHVSSNSNAVGNLTLHTTMETIREILMDTQGDMDSQCAEEHLNGANDQGHLEGILHSTESNLAVTVEPFDPVVIESHMDIQQQVPGHLDGVLHSTEISGSITVKATYKELSVRIVFSLTWMIDRLIEEVGKKFQLEVNKYRLLYQDEDKESMLLTCVEDLKYALYVAESLGSKFVRLSVIDYVV